MDDGMAIDVIDGSHDAVLEFLFGSHADVAQDGAGELREEALDQVEPGAVLGREGKVEAALAAGCRARLSGFPRNVCPEWIVEDQLDRGAGRIGGIEKLEEFDELAAAVATALLTSAWTLPVSRSIPANLRLSVPWRLYS